MKTFSRIVLLIIAALFTDYLLGASLIYAHEPLQGQTDGKAEVDGHEAGGESDYATAQRSGPEPLPLVSDRCDDAMSYPRETYVSGVFRPPSSHV